MAPYESGRGVDSQNPPVNIGYVQSVAERGGLEVILLNILRHLDRDRFNPTVFIFGTGPLVEEILAAGAEAVILPERRTRDLGATRRLIRQLADELATRRIRLVHTMSPHAHVVGGRAARRVGARCLLHLQTVPQPSLNHHGLLSLASVLSPTDCTIACSQWVADAYAAAWRGMRRARVLYSGIDLATLGVPEGGLPVREEFGIAPDAPLVLLAARLQRWKGVHVFIDAAAELARRYPPARFMVAGGALFGLEPEYAEGLHRQARDLRLGEQLVFTGHRTDIYRIMAAADIVVHTSIEGDPLPTVVLEAMALGKPVVASALGGPLEMVEEGVTGCLVSPGRAGELARAIGGLLEDDRTRQRMGEAGKNRMQRLFTAQAMVGNLGRLYQELLCAPTRQGRARAVPA